MLSPNKMFRTVAGLALFSGAGANAAKGAITLVGTVPGYTNGTVIASGTGLNNTVLDATVQYAVFEPVLYRSENVTP